MKSHFTCPMRLGEDPLSPPPFTDPRLTPWMEFLTELGVLEGPDFKVVVPNAKLMRGVGGGNYLFFMEWDEITPEPPQHPAPEHQ